MDKNQFLAFCRSEFTKYGFRKRKSMFYLSNGKDVLCGLWLKKSSFGEIYSVYYYYFIGTYELPEKYPERYDFDFAGTINVLSRSTRNGKQFFTGGIEYEGYSEEELTVYFKDAFESQILPPIINGKKELLMCHEHLRISPTKDKTDIIKKLG